MRISRGVRVEHADALAFDYDGYAGAAGWRVAGNLPYNIATPLLIKLAQMERPPERIVAMIQKDVADRLLAKPGTAAYGSLTVALAVSMRAERAFNVAPGQFFPRPKVVSTVVVLHRLATPLVPPRAQRHFEQVVRGAFAYRRKTLVNSLSLALELPRERIAAALLALDLDADIRGEALDLQTFAASPNCWPANASARCAPDREDQDNGESREQQRSARRRAGVAREGRKQREPDEDRGRKPGVLDEQTVELARGRSDDVHPATCAGACVARETATATVATTT